MQDYVFEDLMIKWMRLEKSSELLDSIVDLLIFWKKSLDFLFLFQVTLKCIYDALEDILLDLTFDNCKWVVFLR